MTDMLDRSQIAAVVTDTLATTPIIDMHTHLYPPSFGSIAHAASADYDPTGLMSWGIDELLTYHYLVAELFRIAPDGLTPSKFYALDKPAQADIIWRELFVERTPISESCRGVLTCLQALGLDTADRNLDAFRTWFAEQEPDAYTSRVMKIANVDSITMTNDPFDDNERVRWETNPEIGADERFEAVLRLDPLLIDWQGASKRLNDWGYAVSETIDDATIDSVRKFLKDWIDRMGAIYLAVSLPPDWRFPYEGDDAQQAAGHRILTEAIVPVCAERGLPFAMMIGVVRGVNPALGQAGDMGFIADVRSVTNLCSAYPDNKFLCTMLARENQHELAVAGRKCGNLMVFGCWWFLNNPSLIEEITRMRIELLGTSFIPQHSDCRVLEQLIYKWSHSRAAIGKVLTDKFTDTAATGWALTETEIQRTIADYVRDNFLRFTGRE